MRPSKDQYFLEIAKVVATRATCTRRAVGCVITDNNGYVLSTGYNGVPRGFEHCTVNPCPGANSPSGTNLDACQALHAEANAIARLEKPFSAETLYCTTAPCMSCTKLVLATGIKRIVFDEDYPSSGKELWLKAGKKWVHKYEI